MFNLSSHSPATYFVDAEVVHNNENTFLQKMTLSFHQTCF